MTAEDWLAVAATQARRHIADGLRPGFSSKGWREFDDRLNHYFERLFRLLHRLYGWQYDFSWTVESMVATAANGFVERPKRLRRADRRAAGEARAWITDPATTWASARLDQLTAGLEVKIDSLRELGVTHLYLNAPGASSKDTGRLATELADANIELVLDLVCSHTASDHPWAQSATSGGPEAGFYFFYADRKIPDQFASHLRTVFPDRSGDVFSWHPEVQGGRWVWTTFADDRWDLDYSNPRVLAAMATELLSLANLGAGVIGLDGIPFLWKAEGTTCEDLAEAHIVVQVLRVLANLAAPSVSFLAGATVASDQVPAYVNPEECHLGFDSLLMSSVWEALATNDTRLLRIALDEQPALSPGCTKLSYLADKDVMAWLFDDAAAIRLGIDPRLHRRYLDSFYDTGGSIASLSGLEAAQEEMDPAKVDLAIRRTMVAWAVVVGAGGIPLLVVDRDTLSLNDLTAESQVYIGIKRLLSARRALTGVDPTTPVEVLDPGDNGLVAFRRGRSLLAANLTAHTALVARDHFPEGDYLDLIAEEIWDGHALGPYEYRFVQL